MRYQFDRFAFAPDTLELFEDGQPVRLQRQPALVLRLLIEHAGDLVTRDALRNHIWGDDRHVDVDRSMAYCLRQIRVALGDDPQAPRFVETLRGLGYRFVAVVQESTPVALPAQAPRSNRDWRVIVAGLCVVGAMVGTAVGFWLQGDEPVKAGHDLVLERADTFINRGQVEDVKVALAAYSRVLSASPSSTRALAGVATAESLLATHHRDLRAAQGALLKSIEAARLAPDDPDVLVAYARSLHAVGRLDEAASAYASAIRVARDRPRLLTDLAALEFQRGRFDTAVQLLARQWRDGEADTTSADLMAMVLTNLGFETEAREWSRLAEDLMSEPTQPRYLQALAAYRDGRLDEAERMVVPLLAEPDPGARVVSLAALVLARRRGADAVLPSLIAAAATLPDANNVRTLLADVYRAVGRQDDERRERARVMEICQRGVNAAPQSPTWARCLVQQLAQTGDVEAVVFWYDRAVDLGWRQLARDREDGWLQLVMHDPRMQAIQARMATDIARMRQNVEHAGVPIAEPRP